MSFPSLYFHAPLPLSPIGRADWSSDPGHWCSLSFERDLFVRAPIGRGRGAHCKRIQVMTRSENCRGGDRHLRPDVSYDTVTQCYDYDTVTMTRCNYDYWKQSGCALPALHWYRIMKWELPRSAHAKGHLNKHGEIWLTPSPPYLNWELLPS